MALIELAGIERVFTLGDSEVHALSRVDLSISAGGTPSSSRAMPSET